MGVDLSPWQADAVLVAAFMTKPQANALADWNRCKGKELRHLTDARPWGTIGLESALFGTIARVLEPVATRTL